MALTVDKLKENFEKKGKRDVYLVVGGQRKARYGKGHEIAVKLGLKDVL